MASPLDDWSGVTEKDRDLFAEFASKFFDAVPKTTAQMSAGGHKGTGWAPPCPHCGLRVLNATGASGRESEHAEIVFRVRYAKRPGWGKLRMFVAHDRKACERKHAKVAA